VIIDVDNYPTGAVATGSRRRTIRFERLDLGRGGIGIRVANRSTGTSRTWSFDDVQVSNPSNGQGGMWGLLLWRRRPDVQRGIRGGLIAGHDVAIMSAFVGQLEIYGTDFEQNKIEAWTNDRFGGGADGNMMFSGVTSEGAQYFIFRPEQHRLQLHHRFDANCRRAGTNGFLMQLNRPIAIKSSWVCGGEPPFAESANGNAPNPQPIFSMQNSYGDASPFRNATAATCPTRMTFMEFYRFLANGVVRIGYLNHAPSIEPALNVGTVSANTTLAFSTNSCQKISNRYDGTYLHAVHHRV